MKTVNESPRKAWSAPVLEQLTIDLDAIAASGKSAGDASPGNPNKLTS
jgi:hypothetical protein